MLSFGDNLESTFVHLPDKNENIYQATHYFSSMIYDIQEANDNNESINIDLNSINKRYIKLQKNANLFSYFEFKYAENIYWNKNAVDFLLKKDYLTPIDNILKLLVYQNIILYENKIHDKENMNNIKEKKIKKKKYKKYIHSSLPSREALDNIQQNLEQRIEHNLQNQSTINTEHSRHLQDQLHILQNIIIQDSIEDENMLFPINQSQQDRNDSIATEDDILFFDEDNESYDEDDHFPELE